MRPQILVLERPLLQITIKSDSNVYAYAQVSQIYRWNFLNSHDTHLSDSFLQDSEWRVNGDRFSNEGFHDKDKISFGCYGKLNFNFLFFCPSLTAVKFFLPQK